MHAGVWETVADALFWLQLCWVFSGFVLMAYLAFKVFPDSSSSLHSNSDFDRRSAPRGSGFSDGGAVGNIDMNRVSNPLMIAGNYRLESFPPCSSPGKVIKFRATLSGKNRRMS